MKLAEYLDGMAKKCIPMQVVAAAKSAMQVADLPARAQIIFDDGSCFYNAYMTHSRIVLAGQNIACYIEDERILDDPTEAQQDLLESEVYSEEDAWGLLFGMLEDINFAGDDTVTNNDAEEWFVKLTGAMLFRSFGPQLSFVVSSMGEVSYPQIDAIVSILKGQQSQKRSLMIASTDEDDQMVVALFQVGDVVSRYQIAKKIRAAIGANKCECIDGFEPCCESEGE